MLLLNICPTVHYICEVNHLNSLLRRPPLDSLKNRNAFWDGWVCKVSLVSFLAYLKSAYYIMQLERTMNLILHHTWYE